jgi:hypothetical protein
MFRTLSRRAVLPARNVALPVDQHMGVADYGVGRCRRQFRTSNKPWRSSATPPDLTVKEAPS